MEVSYRDRMYPVPFVAVLELTRIQVISFLRIAGIYCLGRGKAGDGRAKARAECEMLPPLCSVVIRTLVGTRSDLKLQEQKP